MAKIHEGLGRVPTCPEHDRQLTSQDTQYGTRWFCMEEGCTVVCWEGSTSTPADQETRQARSDAHELFDPLYEDEGGPFENEDEAYYWLQRKMGLTTEEAHIGKFSKEQCEELIRQLGGRE